MPQPGSLAQGQIGGMSQLSAGSQVVKDLVAKLLAQAGIAPGTAPGSIRGNQRVPFLQAAQSQMGVPKTMLGSLLGKIGVRPPRDFRTRLMGDDVPATPQQLQQTYALSGSPYLGGVAPAGAPPGASAGPAPTPQAQPAAPPGPPPVPGAIWNGVQWVMPQNQGGTSLGGGNNASMLARSLAGRSVGRY